MQKSEWASILHPIFIHNSLHLFSWQSKRGKHPLYGKEFLLKGASEKNSNRTVIPKKGRPEELGNRRRRKISQISTISNPQERCHIVFAEFLLKQLQIINKEAEMLKTK